MAEKFLDLTPDDIAIVFDCVRFYRSSINGLVETDKASRIEKISLILWKYLDSLGYFDVKQKYRKEIVEEIIKSIEDEVTWAKNAGMRFDDTIEKILKIIRGD